MALKGLKVGHWTHRSGKRGLTVFLFNRGARACRLVLGGAPATRETDLLDEGMLVQRIDGLIFTGGSAFGLGAAQGVMEYLEQTGRGFETGVRKVPIVLAAAIFDLCVGDPTLYPGPREAYIACKNAREGEPEIGQVGAGAGATVGKVLGTKFCSPGGFGYASLELEVYTIAAFSVVNALGNVVDPDSGEIISGVRNPEGGGFVNAEETILQGKPVFQFPTTNTTLIFVVTDAPISRRGLYRMCVAAHDAIARCIRPSHTPYDGDIVFSATLSDDEKEDDYLLLRISTLTNRVTCESILKAVKL